ncbi:MAG: CPBP family intramembrane metalloprotease, partial [Clostridia bacterium]|nr:CPBP family intramembrane metalloprotease [Clostridia bacterium]
MRKMQIPVLVILACLAMGLVDAVIQPGYAIKSAIKLLLFLLIPVLYGCFHKETNIKSLLVPDKKGFTLALLLGFGVYLVILGAYFAFRNIFDFSALTGSLNETTGVNRSNFLWV